MRLADALFAVDANCGLNDTLERPVNDIFGQQQRDWGRRDRGFSPLDLVELSPVERKAMNLFLRHGHLSLVEMIDKLEMDQGAVQSMLDAFVDEGMVRAFQIQGEQHYRPHMARKRVRKVPANVWAALEKLDE